MNGKHDLLLEIGCEEIPSRFLAGAMTQLAREAEKLLKDYRLGHGILETWATPRRIVLKIGDLDAGQFDLVEKIKGPPVDRAYDQDGQPTKALLGFMQSQQVSIEQITEETIKEARYIMVDKESPGRSTEELLPELLPRLIQKISFPRPMYWRIKEIRFARPIRWLLAIYNQKTVSFDFADVRSGSVTYGHRFLAPGPFTVNSLAEYFRCLEDHYIVLDHRRRQEIIRQQLIEQAEACGGVALIEKELLDEVTFLVEYPVAITGSFDRSYLDLPQEVPITSMQYHQRYFPVVEASSGKLLPHFIGISNNRFHANIRKGYEKVLQARLADGRFFFDEDRKEPLEKYVDKLKSVVFLEQLGSVDHKRARLVALVGKIGAALELSAQQIENARRVAHLCKADLVTGLVGEFPELQGVMGREYARLSGEAEVVAVGIYEHYQPRFSGDKLPVALEGALVSLADRIDTLAGCFAIGIQPTGSQDPYALRRQAQGAIAILTGLGLNLSIRDYIAFGLEGLSGTVQLDAKEIKAEAANLYDFLLQRIRFALQEEGIEHDVIEAVLAVSFRAPQEVFKKAAVLEEYLKGPLLDEVITAYNRVANLAQKSKGGIIDRALFADVSEKELYRSLQAVETAIKDSNDPALSLEKLQLYSQPIDKFFDNVMVMVEDEKIRQNRINLLAALKKSFNRLADFSKLQTP